MSGLNNSNGGFTTSKIGGMGKKVGKFAKAGVFAALTFGAGGTALADDGTKSVSYLDWCENNPQECKSISDRREISTNQVNAILLAEPVKIVKTEVDKKVIEFGTAKVGEAQISPMGLISADGKTRVGINQSGVKGLVESDNIRVEAELKTAINGINDNRVKAQFTMLLDAAKQYSLYASYEKGSEISLFSLAGAMKVEGGIIKVSAAFLNKMMDFDFSGYKKFREEVSQKSIGINYTHDLSNEIFRNIKTSLAYYEAENINFGGLGYKVIDDSVSYEQSEVFGGARGGDTIIARAGTDIKLPNFDFMGYKIIDDNFKITPNVGVENGHHNSIGNLSGRTDLNLTGGVGATYQPNSHNQLTANANFSQSGNSYSGRYGHQLDGVELYVEANHRDGVNGMKDENRVFAGIKATFGGPKQSKYSPLFPDKKANNSLTFEDAKSDYEVAGEQFKVNMEKVTWDKTIVRVKKEDLAEGDKLVLNADKTLKAETLGNGGFTVESIDSISDSSYSPYFGIISGQLAIIDFIGLEKHMTSQGLQTGQIKIIKLGLKDASGYSVYTIPLTKSSVKVGHVDRLHGLVSASEAQQFVSSGKTIDELKIDKINAINRTNLNNVITTAQGLDIKKYTTIGWLSFQTALTNAIALKNNLNATQEQVDKATTNLQKSMDSLVLVANKTTLISKITEAEKLNKDDYVKLGYDNLQLVLAKVKAVNNNVDATQKEVDEAIKLLEDAVKNLVSLDKIPPTTSVTITPYDTYARVVISSDKAGEIRYIYQLDTLTAPTLDAIKAGTQLSMAKGDNTITITGLNQQKGHKLYIITKNTNGNWQTAETVKAFTTTATPVVDTPPSPNNAPVPTYTTFTMDEDTVKNGTLTATDADGNALTFAKITDPTHGTVSINANGTFTYTPTANYFGPDSFTYSVFDGTATVNQVVNITINDVAEPPAENNPGTIAPPTLASKTSTTATLNLGAVTGMTNVKIVAYNNADLADGNKVAENTTGIFSGLSPSTTYYFVMIGTDPNENTLLDEIKKSTTLTVTTDVIPAPTGVSITGSTLSWNSVSGADLYQVCRDGGATCQETANTNFALLAGHHGKTLTIQSSSDGGATRSVVSNSVTADLLADAPDSTALTGVNEGDTVNQTVTIANEPVKVISGNTIGGVVIATTSSYSTTIDASGTAGVANNYSGNITIEDQYGNQKTVQITLVVASPI